MVAGVSGAIAHYGISESKWTYRIKNTKGNYNFKLYKSGWTPRGAVGKGLPVYKVSTLGEGLSNTATLITTGIATYDIATGQAEPITYVDATVGWAGIASTLVGYYAGIEIPYVGEVVAIYGTARTLIDLGYYFGPSHWFGTDDTKWFK